MWESLQNPDIPIVRWIYLYCRFGRSLFRGLCSYCLELTEEGKVFCWGGIIRNWDTENLPENLAREMLSKQQFPYPLCWSGLADWRCLQRLCCLSVCSAVRALKHWPVRFPDRGCLSKDMHLSPDTSEEGNR